MRLFAPITRLNSYVGWMARWMSYAGGVIHDGFCDTAMGSGRGKEEEDGREGKYNGVNRGENQSEQRRPASWPVPLCRF